MVRWLHELSWLDVKEYLESDDRIIIPVGSVEQHGKFAPLGTDAMLAIALAEDVSNLTGVVVTPPLWFGWSPHHMAAPGTISIRPEVLIEILYDVISSLNEHGFKKFLIINGHRIVNVPWIQIAAERAKRLLKIKVVLFDPAYMSKEVVDKLGFNSVGHSEEIEVSHLMYKFPHLVKVNLIRDFRPSEKHLYHIDPRDPRDTLCYIPSTKEDMIKLAKDSGDYITGSPSKACAEKGMKYHQHLVNRLIEVLEQLRRDQLRVRWRKY